MQWPRWSELVVAIAALAVAGLIGFAVGGVKASAPSGRLTVTATGTSQVIPNLATVNVGAVETATTAQAALNKLAKVSTALVAAVEKQGVAAKDIQTSNLSVNQQYNNQNQPIGYQANEQFTITVRKLSSAAQVVASSFSAGANQGNGISFTEMDPNAGQQQAVDQALRAAKRQAKSEAAQLGVALVKVVNVQLRSQGIPGPIYASLSMKSAGVAAPALQPGTQSVTVQMQVTYSYR